MITRYITAAAASFLAILGPVGQGVLAQSGGGRNPTKIRIGAPSARDCLRHRLNRLANSGDNQRRRVQIACSGVLTPNPDSGHYPRPHHALSLYLTSGEAACLRDILDENPNTPQDLALARCHVGEGRR